MTISIFGSTGRVGSRVISMLLSRGYTIKALARSPENLNDHPLLQKIHGNALEYDNVYETIKGTELVISTLGTDKSNTLQQSTPLIIQAMENEKISRIITTGTAGILNARKNNTRFRYETNESRRRRTTAAQDHAASYRILKQSSLNWTIACPTFLPEGEASGTFRTEVNYLPQGGSSITTGDTALFLFKLAAEKEFYYQNRVGLAY